jgi:hypothetical protein
MQYKYIGYRYPIYDYSNLPDELLNEIVTESLDLVADWEENTRSQKYNKVYQGLQEKYFRVFGRNKNTT